MEKNDKLRIFSERLRKMREAKGLTLEEIAPEIGEKPSTWASWEQAENFPRIGKKRKLAEFLGVSSEWLYGDDVPPNVRESKLRAGRYLIPLVSMATAGKGRSYEDICNQLERMVESDCADPNAFAVIVEGDSMHPDIPDGSEVAINPHEKPIEGKPALIKDKHGRIYLKLFFEPEEGKVLLRSINHSKHPDKILKHEEIEWIYRAHGLIQVKHF